MKKSILVTAAFLFIYLNAINAQVIPNSNFETWSNDSIHAPDGWESSTYINPNFQPITRTTDKYLGKYAVRIESIITSTDTTRGVLNTVRPNFDHGFGPAFAINTRYNNLKGFYKYAPQNGDSAQIVVYITKTGFTNPIGFGNLAAFGQKHLAAASTYTPFSVGYFDSLPNIVYFDNSVVPDSGYIALAAYKAIGLLGGLMPLGNSVLYVDALNFDTYLAGVNPAMDITTNFQLFPNANSGIFDVCFSTNENEYTTIKIYNMEGKEMADLYNGNLASGMHTLHHNVNQLSNGNYIYVVASPKGYKVEKLVIQKQ